MYRIIRKGVNPERVPEYWVKTGNQLRVPGFLVFNTWLWTRVSQLSGPGGILKINIYIYIYIYIILDLF
jgi:hypothetical protein